MTTTEARIEYLEMILKSHDDERIIEEFNKLDSEIQEYKSDIDRLDELEDSKYDYEIYNDYKYAKEHLENFTPIYEKMKEYVDSLGITNKQL